jgi:hypothetical protein
MDLKKIDLFGKSYSINNLKESLKDAVGDISTIAGVKPYTLFEGPERGVFAVDVWTGSGLRYTVVPDRGMNICNLNYRGIPLDWTSGTGITSPFLYESHGWNWLRSFHGGIVHTCGLSNVGEPCVDEKLEYENREFGGHGRISSTPARELLWKTDDINNLPTMTVSGKCRVVSALEENLVLERSLVSEIGGSKITLQDRVTNLGYKKTPVLLLYHCNFGFPLLSGNTLLSIPAENAVDWNGSKAPDFKRLKNPTNDNDESVVYPDLIGDQVNISLFNPDLGNRGLGVKLKYSKTDLPFLTVWKHFQKRSYVVGIEPGTCRVEGRNSEIEKKRAVFLEKDRSLTITLEIEVLDGGQPTH